MNTEISKQDDKPFRTNSIEPSFTETPCSSPCSPYSPIHESPVLKNPVERGTTATLPSLKDLEKESGFAARAGKPTYQTLLAEMIRAAEQARPEWKGQISLDAQQYGPRLAQLLAKVGKERILSGTGRLANFGNGRLSCREFETKLMAMCDRGLASSGVSQPAQGTMPVPST